MAKKPQPPSVQQTAIGDGNVQVAGDRNTVNIVQKFFNIFKSDTETLEQRNRRILLGHVENAWIKGVLDASLHGAALLDLGIKPDPEAVTQYPWAIKKESTDETLPAGTSMLEIFDSIGMGRSLLILGAPGSGKTTMLLELARQLIARASEDITQPIPMVFNLASWTEKFTLADWLAQELNNLYSVPRKTAPDWVKGDKLLLLLDGLDEVRQDSRAKCVEAINSFRKDHGLTSLAVCSRSQDYADLNTKLSFEGAIEVQPLTQEQITEFFNRFGKEMAGIKQVLKKDSALREMAETPLFLSIMLMAYRDKRDVDILVSKDEKAQRKYLFDTYIERMFERSRSKNTVFGKHDNLHWLSWLASKMVEHNAIPYLLEDMQPNWFGEKKRIWQYKIVSGLIFGLFFGLIFVVSARLINLLVIGLIVVLIFWLNINPEISTVDSISWSWSNGTKVSARIGVLIGGLLFGLMGGVIAQTIAKPIAELTSGEMVIGLMGGLILWLCIKLIFVLNIQQIDRTTYFGQRLIFSAKNSLFAFLLFGLIVGLIFGLPFGLAVGLIGSWIGGVIGGVNYGGSAFIQHYILRFFFFSNNLLPWRLVPFLDHCVDLIFLRRVGGGYIFVHRLLMEHFAEMYVETPASKGN